MYVRAGEEKVEAISKFTKKGLVLTSHAADWMLEHGLDPDEVALEAEKKGVWLVAEEFLLEFLDGRKHPVVEERVVVEKTKYVPSKDIESRLRIREDSDVTGKSTCEGLLENFVDYFNSKYSGLRDILRDRDNLRAAVPINVARKNREEKNISVIVMVSSKRETKKGHCLLEVEDPTGELTVLVSNTETRMQLVCEQILPDEVIGISGRFANDLFIANELFQPDLPLDNKTRSADEEVYAAFLSDIHVGSYLFLEKEFNRFLDCLNLKGDNCDLFEKVKYVVVAGDLVDGIGIYPNQEKELSIPDIYKQYDFLASLLERIPEHIEVVLAMGNHDAVRNAEPQPRLDEDLGAPLYALSNVHVVGNPVTVSLHGVNTLMYHGTSLDTVIGSLAGSTYEKPEAAMIEYLKRRYLVPVYGNDSLSPEKQDYLLIKDIPDILHCGHVHTNGYASYRGVKVINSGTWQARTKYQEELGHMPTPGRVPLINLQNHEVSVIHFYDEG